VITRPKILLLSFTVKKNAIKVRHERDNNDRIEL